MLPSLNIVDLFLFILFFTQQGFTSICLMIKITTAKNTAESVSVCAHVTR